MVRRRTFPLTCWTRRVWGWVAVCVFLSGVAGLPLLHQLEHRASRTSTVSIEHSHLQANWDSATADALQALSLSEESEADPVGAGSSGGAKSALGASSAASSSPSLVSHSHSHSSSSQEHDRGSLWHFGCSLFQPLVLPAVPCAICPTTYRRPPARENIPSFVQGRPAQPRAPPVA